MSSGCIYFVEGDNMELPKDVATFIDTVRKDYGQIIIQPKNSSKLMKTIGWLFKVTKISPDFMTRYITTIGHTVYFPDEILSNPDSESMLRVVVHETIHVNDTKSFSKPLFGFLYLFPQSLAPLALLSLLAFWKLSFIWCLLFLVCLLPIPAPFRYWFELRAYRTSILFARKDEKLTDEQMIPTYEWIEKQLCTNLYYWTWPFPSMVRKHLKDESWMGTNIYKKISSWLAIRRIVRKISSAEKD
jgi:hypothetical protein